MPDPNEQGPSSVGAIEEAVRLIRDHLGRIRFGSIALTVHEGRVVQLDITEKKRFL